jgi:hypothetical protein
MKLKLLKFFAFSIFLIPITVLCVLWNIAATGEELRVFEISRGVFIEHGKEITVGYDLVIGKGQVNPYGTIWKTTYGDGWLSAEPQIEGPTLQKMMRNQGFEVQGR